MTAIRTDKLWDLTQPICHDGPVTAVCWARAVAWELDDGV